MNTDEKPAMTDLRARAADATALARKGATPTPTDVADVVRRLRNDPLPEGVYEAFDVSRATNLMEEAATLIRSLAASPSPAAKMGDETFSFKDHLQRQREWSEKTFGPGPRTAGVIDHIRKELNEIEADPSDVSEWIDVVILGLDGAWRAGHSPQQIIEALVAKQTKNEGRSWPDWRTAPPDKAIEHNKGSCCPHCGYRHPPDGMCLS